MRFWLLLLFAGSAFGHEMTPAYPKLVPSYIPGILKTDMEMFNRRADVEFYEIGVFDKEWNTVPFVTAYKILRLKYLGHVKFEVFIKAEDARSAYYICSKSKLRSEVSNTPMVSSRICSKVKD